MQQHDFHHVAYQSDKSDSKLKYQTNCCFFELLCLIYLAELRPPFPLNRLFINLAIFSGSGLTCSPMLEERFFDILGICCYCFLTYMLAN